MAASEWLHRAARAGPPRILVTGLSSLALTVEFFHPLERSRRPVAPRPREGPLTEPHRTLSLGGGKASSCPIADARLAKNECLLDGVKPSDQAGAPFSDADPQETSIGTLPDHPGLQHRRRGAAPMLRIVERADRPASWGRTKGEKPTTHGKGGALFSSTSVTMARISLVVAGLSEELADQEVVSLPSFVGRPAVCQVRPTAQVGFSLLDRRRRSGP